MGMAWNHIVTTMGYLQRAYVTVAIRPVDSQTIVLSSKCGRLRGPLCELSWRGDEMRRREVLSLLGGAVVSWPHLAKAQYIDRLHKIGVLIPLAETDPDVPPRIASFEQGLRELGWFKERNILIHYRFAPESDQLKAHARELALMQPDLIVAGTGLVVAAVLRESTTVPIVFVTTLDPVANGYVRALRQPGGNLTGFTWPLPSLGGKWLQ